MCVLIDDCNLREKEIKHGMVLYWKIIKIIIIMSGESSVLLFDRYYNFAENQSRHKC